MNNNNYPQQAPIKEIKQPLNSNLRVEDDFSNSFNTHSNIYKSLGGESSDSYYNTSYNQGTQDNHPATNINYYTPHEYPSKNQVEERDTEHVISNSSSSCQGYISSPSTEVSSNNKKMQGPACTNNIASNQLGISTEICVGLGDMSQFKTSPVLTPCPKCKKYISSPSTEVSSNNKKMQGPACTNNIASNQLGASTEICVGLGDMSQFKTSPVLTPCPKCKKTAFTRVNRKLSVNNVACCVVFSTIPWILFQALRNKDMNCFNAEHHCSQCNSKILDYNAC
eukprot:CAMPEP_0170536138 /NCGR_PEP_ID=MMETSP0209-20121228/101983_1 /TAXON_ID=665100 ORGANISM="Litonotus pictus, Strain P1" /NCGR_SAMPLE_ID=MMETSP0209 /ASSEMBLY_ACC=CAM_ASM_000301 /LENGTH=280 /DNA_ID=CAMNT_0010837473 /DNA_START=21 /DNA_END=863 /DNA_ORIENTATION=+